MKEPSETKIEALDHIGDGLHSLSRAIDRLGTGNAATEMGAIECLAVEVREGSTRIANALIEIAEALRDR